MTVKEKRLLVVDANVISHALTPSQTKAYSELFTSLEKDYRFVVTGFTKFELTRSSDKAYRHKIHTYIKQEMILVDLSDILIEFASRLAYLYKHHVSTKGHKISEGDIVNAALSIVKKSPILTMDSLDYPTPFFQETDRRRVEYKSNRKRDVIDTVYILAPDMSNIQYCFKEHDA